MTPSTIVLFILGLGLLILGAEWLVRGASRLAIGIGISPLVVGLTVVAFGTSSPEFAVSLKAAMSGQANLALGNVVGSNIFNVLFILGIAAIIAPLVVSRQLVRLDVPIMIAASVAVMWMAGDGMIGRGEGIVLFAALVGYVTFLIVDSIRAGKAPAEAGALAPPASRGAKGVAIDVGLIVVGLALLVIGSRWLVTGAVQFAQALGISEMIVGLTIVAAGTSLPEVAASVIASIKGERDIAVGNVVGSNLFNILGVLGAAAFAAPTGIAVDPSALAFDIPVMVAVALCCLPIFFSGAVISRMEGAVLLCYYVAYTSYLILLAMGHPWLFKADVVILEFILPLTAIALLLPLFEEIRAEEILLKKIPPEDEEALAAIWRHTRRLIVGVVGTTVVLFGLVLILTPGPGVLAIGGGLAILGTEFLWARRLMRKVKRTALAGLRRYRDLKDQATGAPK